VKYQAINIYFFEKNNRYVSDMANLHSDTANLYSDFDTSSYIFPFKKKIEIKLQVWQRYQKHIVSSNPKK